MSDQGLLDVYLSDHFAGATAGAELARRHAGQEGAGEEAAAIAREIEADREVLREVMEATAVQPARLKVAVAWIGERAGRLKLNDRVFGRSPLSDVVEIESLIVGVSGKLQLWRALQGIADRDARLAGFDFPALAARAEDQRRRLEQMHSKAVSSALKR